jgi:hypothetical protein
MAQKYSTKASMHPIIHLLLDSISQKHHQRHNGGANTEQGQNGPNVVQNLGQNGQNMDQNGQNIDIESLLRLLPSRLPSYLSQMTPNLSKTRPTLANLGQKSVYLTSFLSKKDFLDRFTTITSPEWFITHYLSPDHRSEYGVNRNSCDKPFSLGLLMSILRHLVTTTQHTSVIIKINIFLMSILPHLNLNSDRSIVINEFVLNPSVFMKLMMWWQGDVRISFSVLLLFYLIRVTDPSLLSISNRFALGGGVGGGFDAHLGHSEEKLGHFGDFQPKFGQQSGSFDNYHQRLGYNSINQTPKLYDLVLDQRYQLSQYLKQHKEVYDGYFVHERVKKMNHNDLKHTNPINYQEYWCDCAHHTHVPIGPERDRSLVLTTTSTTTTTNQQQQISSTKTDQITSKERQQIQSDAIMVSPSPTCFVLINPNQLKVRMINISSSGFTTILGPLGLCEESLLSISILEFSGEEMVISALVAVVCVSRFVEPVDCVSLMGVGDEGLDVESC